MTQTVAEPEIVGTGRLFTVTADVVLLHPVVDWVNVKVTEPGEIPVIMPEFVTVAIEGLLLVQIPPVAGDRFEVLFTHKAEGAVTTGNALILTDVVVEFMHPSAPVNE